MLGFGPDPSSPEGYPQGVTRGRGSNLSAPGPEQPREARGCVSFSPLRIRGKGRSHKFCPGWAPGADSSHSLCQPRGAVRAKRLQKKRSRFGPSLAVGSGAAGWTHSEGATLGRLPCGSAAFAHGSPPSLDCTAGPGGKRSERAAASSELRARAQGPQYSSEGSPSRRRGGGLSGSCCGEVTSSSEGELGPQCGRSGGFPKLPAPLCPSVRRGRGGRTGSSGFLDREAQEEAQRFPEKPRRAHGAPDLARCPRPAEPRLQEKGRILPAEGTRCVGGMPPPRWPARHCSTRVPHRRPGGGKGRSPRPLPVPRRHERLLRPKVLGNNPGTARANEVAAAPGERRAGGRGRERARASRESRGAGVGTAGRSRGVGDPPGCTVWGRPRAEQRRVSLAAASTAAKSALSELLGRREGRLAGLGSRGGFGGRLAAGPSRGGVL